MAIQPTTSQELPVSTSMMPIVGPSHVPNKLAIISPLLTEGPVTYKTLIEVLESGPVPYQLWLLVPVAMGEGDSFKAERQPLVTQQPRSDSEAPKSQAWGYSPAFTPVSGVDATPVAWPDRATPRVVTIQYNGLEINQAINWAIRQAHGDMVLVLDSGLSGLLQLKQVLEEIQAATTTESEQTEVAAVTSGVLGNRMDPFEGTTDGTGAVGTAASVGWPATASALEGPHPTALERRLLERLEAWGVALRRQADVTRQRHRGSRSHIDLSEAVQDATREQELGIPASGVNEAASGPTTEGSQVIRRIDQQDRGTLRKLPKFITRFHEFI